MKFTRRDFIEVGVLGSLAVGTARAISVPQVNGLSSANRELSERDALRTVMDEIIPAGDGMPAASETGGLDYLDRLMAHDSHIAETLRHNLVALERLSREHFQSPITLLPHDKRLTVLAMFERQNVESFSSLRDFVYESYYLQPRVWELVGYKCFATDQAGPQMNAFDEDVLAKVRNKPRNYREV